jgi:NAD(P)-dependent dehydrogenase (short-subunit alcohol dehydrogenase family)
MTYMELRNHVALVTGASSGIGRAIAQALAELGCRVYGAGRNGIQQEDIRAGIFSLRMDVTDERSVKSAVDELLEAEGRIDILVHCAGIGVSGPLEYYDDSILRLQFDTNVFGALK